MVLRLTYKTTVFICLFASISIGLKGHGTIDKDKKYIELVDLYESFRQFIYPEVKNGVPDYRVKAMSKKLDKLIKYQKKLEAIDTLDWSIPQQVDYQLVKSEMNAMEFRHKVTRPWSRDPAFYAVINFQFGPKMARSIRVPEVPMSKGRLKEFQIELRAIPKILDQARKNLVEPKADLAFIGIHTKNREGEILRELIPKLQTDHPELVSDAQSALKAIDQFKIWLEKIRPEIENESGIGIDNYNWYLKNVAMLPYTWDELLLLCQREYERAITSMKLKEYGNRHKPLLDPVDNREDYLYRYNNAMKHMYDFLHKVELFTVPDYFKAPKAANSYLLNTERDYFEHVLDRYPLPLSVHGFLGHDLDAQRHKKDEHPIRGKSRLFFIDGVRAEALATALEKFLSYTGLLDDIPQAEELMYHLKAFRAIRAVADLKMHSNQQTFEEAFQYVTNYTPYGWVPKDSPTIWHDLELYMRKPLYGIGYTIGPVLIERLLTERYLELGKDFNIKKFMDEFMEIGFMPISLLRWEMTGKNQTQIPPYWE